NQHGLGLKCNSASSGNQTYSTTTTGVGPGINEVQSLTITGAPQTYKLTFNGVQTGNIAYNAAPSVVQNALNNLSSIKDVGGSVSVNQSGNIYTISFGGSLSGFNQPTLIANGNSGTLVVVNTIMDGAGAAMELQTGTRLNNGGVTTGLEVWDEHLTLATPGNTLYGDAALNVISNDNLWRGPVTLTRASTVQVPPSTRLTLFGAID